MTEDYVYGLYCVDGDEYNSWQDVVKVYEDKLEADEQAEIFNLVNEEYISILDSFDKLGRKRYNKKIYEYLESIEDKTQELGREVEYIVRKIPITRSRNLESVKP